MQTSIQYRMAKLVQIKGNHSSLMNTCQGRSLSSMSLDPVSKRIPLIIKNLVSTISFMQIQRNLEIMKNLRRMKMKI